MNTKSSYQKVVAIDGPSGSGKSTLAKALAKRCSFLFVDTGAMYRAIALICHQLGVAFEEGPEMNKLLSGLKMEYTGIEGEEYISINGEKLGEKIREHHVSHLASQVSQIPSVRTYLVSFQRKLVEDRCCVMEGRDIGTVVFPQSFCKIYLTASDEVRAARRLEQLESKGQKGLTLEEVIADVRNRDRTDMERSHSPLRQADDAVLLDTSDMNADQVLDRLVEIVRARADESGVEI